MSGLEVLAWIRARPEFSALPIVVFTSSTHDMDVEFSRKHGANAFFVKPSNSDDLAGLVQKLFAATASMSRPTDPLAIDGNRLNAG